MPDAKTKKSTPEDVKKSDTSGMLEELAKSIKNGKDLDSGIYMPRVNSDNRSVPMPRLMQDKDAEIDFGNGLKYKPSQIKPQVPKDGLMLLKKGGSTNKYARGGGIESRGKTKGRFV